jgi:hypothetical protein
MSGQMTLERSRALWNRTHLDLRSDEILAQIMDRGEVETWRELYRLARGDPGLRRRMHRVILRAPIALGRFWLSALASLGEPVDLGAELPEDPGI